MARNRCSYEKRAKEIARKQKQEEKIKRRQNKALPKASEETNESEFEAEVMETEPQQPEEEVV
jgi:hypothetical protein